MITSESLKSLLTAIVLERNDENTEAIGLGGSFARGTASQYSDVDIAHFVYSLPDRARKHYTYRDGRMVNFAMKSIPAEREALYRPERAIFLVPGFRDIQILLDKHGTLTAFIQEVQAFSWEPLQSSANAYASNAMMIETEFAYKILTALHQENKEALAYETMNLLMALTEIMAVQNGVLIQTNSTYFQQVHQSAGDDSAWTRYHRIAAGINQIVAPWPPLTLRGIATLHVFVEMVGLFRPILLQEHKVVIETAAQAIKDMLDNHYPLAL